jgi:16S rRNA (cytidine1402-2'-O)-methyltransferase
MIRMSKLFIVSTPIGNLEDMTFRAVRALKEADLIAAEDTRHTRKLLSHFDIHTRMESFHEHNERSAVGRLIEILKDGRNVALVSDAGTPAISDPGFRLVRAAIEADIEVEAVPGTSAVVTALAVSGMPTDQFTFIGFLPDKEGKRKNRLAELKDVRHTLVFYVSKWKVKKVVSDMIEVLGDRTAVLCRELTKVHEEVVRAPLSKILGHVRGREVKGEMTLVVGSNEWSSL